MHSAIPNLHPRRRPLALATCVLVGLVGLVDTVIHPDDEVAGDKISTMGPGTPTASTSTCVSQATYSGSKTGAAGSTTTPRQPAPACS